MECVRRVTTAKFSAPGPSARNCTAKHGYEVMTKLLPLLSKPRAIIRVISSILRRIIEGLTVDI